MNVVIVRRWWYLISYLCIVVVNLWCRLHCSPGPFRMVKMEYKTDKKNVVFTSYVLKSTMASSLLECAQICVGQEGSESMTFWRRASQPPHGCVCYAATSGKLTGTIAAPEARLYSMHGRMGIGCGRPLVIPFATASAESGYVGDVVTYRCQTGYVQSGRNGARTCNVSGRWEVSSGQTDPASTSCSPVLCGEPPTISFSTPSSKSGYYGDKVTYTCQEGYTQSGGGGTIVCSASGNWEADSSDRPSVCTPVLCGEPPTISFSTPSSKSGYYGDKVTYTCQEGYTQSGGGGTIVCSDSGNWEADSSDRPSVCTPVLCGEPPTVSFSTPSSKSGYYGDKVTYTCQEGYTQSGGGGTIVCSASGNWEADSSDRPSVCTPITKCGQPPTVSGALYIPYKASYQHGDSVTYVCVGDFEKEGGGNGRRECTAQGTWVRHNWDPYCVYDD